MEQPLPSSGTSVQGPQWVRGGNQPLLTFQSVPSACRYVGLPRPGSDAPEIPVHPDGQGSGAGSAEAEMALAADAAEQGGGSQLNVGLGPLCQGERPGKTSRGFGRCFLLGLGFWAAPRCAIGLCCGKGCPAVRTAAKWKGLETSYRKRGMDLN